MYRRELNASKLDLNQIAESEKFYRVPNLLKYKEKGDSVILLQPEVGSEKKAVTISKEAFEQKFGHHDNGLCFLSPAPLAVVKMKADFYIESVDPESGVLNVDRGGAGEYLATTGSGENIKISESELRSKFCPEQDLSKHLEFAAKKVAPTMDQNQSLGV